jgi:hypothetical protein
MGQLRALLSLDLLGLVDYISSVSGGSWAATAFTYYDRAESDADFLGTITPPAAIRLDAIRSIPEGSLGWGATQDLGDAIDAAHNAGAPRDQLWATAIGQVFFARFGLYDPSAPSYFTLDEEAVAAIRAANPSLANAPFHVVRQPRGYNVPYLLINATIDGPTAHAPYDPDQLLMISYSPLYSGIPFQQTVVYPPSKLWALKATVSAVVGGGFIESFAWGCDAPTAPATPDGTVEVAPPAHPFTLAAASGASSSAYAAIFEKIKALDGLLPEENYWPPMATGQVPAQSFEFGDGGNLENYGLIPLLLRGVKKVVVFINTETPLKATYDPTGKTYGSDIDSDLPPLFGIPVHSHDIFARRPAPDTKQVFEEADYEPVVRGLQALKQAGRPMVFHKTHTLRKNGVWGLPGGGVVDVLYVYLDQVTTWQDQLTDPELIEELRRGDLGMFAHFPNYHTIDENRFPRPGEEIPPWNLTELTPQQVNLLADLTCWVITENRDQFTSFIKSQSTT